jgi:hypothetical protein
MPHWFGIGYSTAIHPPTKEQSSLLQKVLPVPKRPKKNRPLQQMTDGDQTIRDLPVINHSESID